MKRFISRILWSVAVVGLLFIVHTSSAQAQDRVIYMPTDIFASPGEEVTIPIMIDNPEGVTSYRVVITVDEDSSFSFALFSILIFYKDYLYLC